MLESITHYSMQRFQCQQHTIRRVPRIHFKWASVAVHRQRQTMAVVFFRRLIIDQHRLGTNVCLVFRVRTFNVVIAAFTGAAVVRHTPTTIQLPGLGTARANGTGLSALRATSICKSIYRMLEVNLLL